jgi:large subunit ribosomal protein L18
MTRIAEQRVQARLARHRRIRKKISGTADRPRLCVRRTLKNMIAQIVDDVSGKSLFQLTTGSKEFQAQFGTLSKTEQSAKLGALMAEKAKELGLNSVVFDRGGYIFHGRVKAVADGAREAGLNF